MVDATLGGAGHALAMAQRVGKGGTLVGFDADGAAIARATERLAGVPCTTVLVQRNFREMDEALTERGVETADAFLFDLGWSSFQLASGRGFSFQTDEPLLMTYRDNPTEDDITAREIVNSWAEESIADILYGWGQERFSRRIAKAIVVAREQEPIETASQLAAIVEQAVPGIARHGRIHPATKTFQALRIAVNDELGALAAGLTGARTHAAPRARIAVITFHSIEDRVVKRLFRSWVDEGFGTLVNKKPIVPGAEELVANPRARSAKLRVFECN